MPLVDGRAIVVRGALLRTARLRDEPYECLDDPVGFIAALKRADVRADLFTFLQEILETEPRYRFRLEWHGVSVLAVTTYAHWWTRQINDKTRNMVRKARRKGVEIRSVEVDDDLIRAIAAIYDERAIIQGKRNRHYGKGPDAMKRMLATFAGRSEFLGAYHGTELIGFAKLVRGNGVTSIMHLVAKTAHRDKAPANALLDRTVELCGERRVPCLHFGAWSRRGLGDFKRHHAFEKRDVPRYFVPLTAKGRWMLGLTLHRGVGERLPESWRAALAGWRDRWNAMRFAARRG